MEKSQQGVRLLEDLDMVKNTTKRFSDQVAGKKKNLLMYWKCRLLSFLDDFRKPRPHCVVCLQVHQIDGLPPAMEGQVLVVGWKTKGCKGEQTLPVHVCNGVAEFNEVFLHYCSNEMQTILKSFSISVSLVDSADCDLGTFHVDLSDLVAVQNLNSNFGGKTMNFILAGMADGGTLSLSVYCRIMEEEIRELIGAAGQKHRKSKCFSCIPDLGCLRSKPVTVCARRIPSLRSDHGFITIENSVEEEKQQQQITINDEDNEFITIEKETVCMMPTRTPAPTCDYLVNTDDDSAEAEDEKPCLAIEINEELEDDDRIEDDFLRMLEEKYWKARDHYHHHKMSLDLGVDMDLESLIKEAEIELSKAAQLWKTKVGGAMLERAEYEDLIKKWLAENCTASQCSTMNHAFGSPV